MFGISSPLQGYNLGGSHTQGVALGYIRLPFRGVKTGIDQGNAPPHVVKNVAIIEANTARFISTNIALIIKIARNNSAKGATYRSPGQRPGLKGRPNSEFTPVMLEITSPLQGYNPGGSHTQGVALGCVSLPLRDVKTGFDQGNAPPPRVVISAAIIETNGTRFISTNIASIIKIAPITSAKGAAYRSPGQRPGYKAHPEHQALKGRPNSEFTKAVK